MFMPFFSSTTPERRAVASAVRLHPWLFNMGVLASHICLVAAAQFSYRQNQGDSPCTERTIPFAGFGALSTRQCDPRVEIVQIVVDANNQTSELSRGLAYFEASSIENIGGSDTQVQVPLECLQSNLFDIVPHIMNTAADANPPLNPFPQDSAGLPCQITVDDMTISTSNGKKFSTIYPSRHISFNLVSGLNAELCTMIVDYLNSQTDACQSVSRVRALDAGKAFLVIGLMIGGAGAIILVGAGGIYCVNACKEVNFNRNNFFSCCRNSNTFEPRAATIVVDAPPVEIAMVDLEGQTPPGGLRL